MDKLNVDNLFPSTNKTKNRPLDVYTLYNNRVIQKDKEIEFSIDSLINFREDKKKRAVEHYERIYEMCLDRIAYANKMSKTDIVYRIPLGIYRCPEFLSKECLRIIETRLRKLYLDTLILDQSSLFISWMNLAQNKKQAKLEKLEQEKQEQELRLSQSGANFNK